MHNGISWLIAFTFWTGIGILFAGSVYMDYEYQQNPITWLQAVLVSMADWYTWAVLSPMILWLGRRFRFSRNRWLKRLLILIVLSLMFVILKITSESVFTKIITNMNTSPSFFRLNAHFLIFWGIVGYGYAYDYYKQFREREITSTRLEAQLAQAQLQVLKMQIHPHFLFNTLHAISTLIRKRPEYAEKMIANLGDLLRLSMQKIDQQTVPLKQELEFLDRYLEIEKIRFQDRLTVEMKIDANSYDALVPYFILQPIVENAIRYSIEPFSTPGKIIIHSFCKNKKLHIQICDFGNGSKVNNLAQLKEGVGLSNTRKRLLHLYGQNQQFNFNNGSHSGFEVAITIPFQRNNF